MEDNKLQIVDNFMHYDYFKEMQKVMSSPDFAWFYSDFVNTPNDGHFQFYHLIYQESVPKSNFFDALKPVLVQLLQQFDLYSLIRIKANLLTKSSSIIEHGYHVDLVDLKDHHVAKTAILYMNTNNGYTKFETGNVVESVENRLVVFDARIKHSGTTCTDENTRTVINFNFF